MLAVAINLREAIDEYCQDFNAELSIDHTDDILSNTDWQTLTEIKGFLEKLSHATKALESPETCIDLTLPNFEYILKIFETAKELNSTNHIVGPMLNSGWQKLQKYYELSDESHAYVTALILNPRRKWKWLEKKWLDQPTWLRDAKRKVQRLWEVEYQSTESTINTSSSRKTTNQFYIDLYDSDDDTFSLNDEYEIYCSTPLINTYDALKWWQEETQQKTFPNLSKMAIDYLSIPAMSTDAERLFSSCKITLTDRRNRLGDDVLEAIECLKSWLKIADQEAHILEDLITSLQGGMESDDYGNGGQENDGDDEVVKPWEVE